MFEFVNERQKITEKINFISKMLTLIQRNKSTSGTATCLFFQIKFKKKDSGTARFEHLTKGKISDQCSCDDQCGKFHEVFMNFHKF